MGHGPYLFRLRELQSARMQYLFGDAYDIYHLPKAEDPDIADILVNDALKTGMWRELPDELQPIYHNRN